MAKKRKQPQGNTSSTETNTFIKGMNKDFNPSYTPKQNWTHARNAANNSVDGDVGLIGNEPANLPCADVPYTIIGAIHRYADQWVIYSTDNSNSEIGLFDDSKCEYTTLVNDPCLNFNKENLIVGAAKENFDCSWQVYWDDGNNPSRTLNIDNIPYVQQIVSAPGDDCVIYEDTDVLDCERLRLAPLLDTPIIELSKATDGGQLRNGTYQAYIAYVINEQRVTDYIGISNLQSLFDHDDTAGSLDLKISNLDKEFEFFELVILSNNQNNYAAKRIGLYSTETSSIGIDFIDPSLPSIALELIPLRNPAYEKSDAMFVVNDWLIRKGPTEQFDFNYQPIANQIKTNWVVAEYPSSYYYKGGNKVGFMRDEQYSFFIRWVYNTGERSNSYHIPGRPPRVNGVNQYGSIIDETAIATNINALDPSEMNFQVFNTATTTAQNLSEPLPGGGFVRARGEMAYWQSTEKYPATKPEIWNSTYVDPETGVNIGNTGDTNYDLCGKYIRHHKMPTEESLQWLQVANGDNTRIRILGVEFTNIGRPKYNDGTYIPNVVGYEILRGSREGAKSILAKGIFRNMREYDIPDQQNAPQGLYPNHPYNDLSPDVYFHDGNNGRRTDGADSYSTSIGSYAPLSGYRQDVFTFHSPEMMFKRPFLNAYETKIYGTKHGKTLGTFINSEEHPQTKLLRNGGVIVASIFGIGYALEKIRGRKKKVYTPRTPLSVDQFGVLGLGTGTIQAPSFGTNTPQSVATSVANAAGQAALDFIINEILLDSAYALGDMATGGTISYLGYDISALVKDGVQSALPGGIGGGWKYDIDGSELKETPNVALILTSLMNFAQQFAVGANEMIEMMYNLISADDMALKYNSHGFYDTYAPGQESNIWRTKNKDSNYIGSVFQNFGDTGQFKINNLFRPKTIAVQTEEDLDDPVVTDNSRFVLGSLSDDSIYRDTSILSIERNCSVLYGALKFNFENQYGQLDQIKQVPMRAGFELIDLELPAQTLYQTAPIFSGDTYIGRYSEKIIMPIFTDFLYGQPENYPFDYLMRTNIPFPRYWMDTKRYDITKLVEDITTLNIGNLENSLPNDMYYLDRPASSTGLGTFQINTPNMPLFSIANSYMYTHVNGINEFYVESEINIAQRDWGDQRRQRHYDIFEYTNLNDLFDAEHIKEDNYYKYDFSLSAARFITNLATYGTIQPRDYDPKVAEKCYTYYPKRLIYSLQAQEESKKDFWRVYLPNNYKDFKNPVNVIKPINKSGAIIFFPYQSPQMFQGLDTLKTDLGTKLTIGDGGLFSQPFQNIVNSDLSNEYGSCESARSVMNTPMGVFFISQAQGKIFHYTGKLENIANNGMKWWFNKYLPSQLIQQFPQLEETPLADNPVVGVGCQTIYDPNDDIVYFCKKDYRLKDEYLDNVTYSVSRGWTFNLSPDSDRPNGFKINLGDPAYFENVSWTVSYDPKAKAWISFHDWHPELSLPSINHFLTTQTGESDEPYCPPGYTYNATTNACERTLDETAPAPVVVDETIATVDGTTDNCLLDIVVAMDVSGSTAGQNRTAQQATLTGFLNDPVVANGMAAGNIQVGFTRWSNNSLSMNPNGFSMSNTITEAAVTTWYNSNWAGGGTNIPAGFQGAQGVRVNRANSELGDRSANPNFRSIIIFITDSTTAPSNNVGCQYQSSTIGGTGQPFEYVVALFCGIGTPPPNLQSILDDLSCTSGPFSFSGNAFGGDQFQFAVDATNPADPAAVAQAIAGSVCTSISCDCPPGYTLVYPTGNTYTGVEGNCDPENPPLCRRVTCDCPPPPFPDATTTETGNCDDVYLAGPNGDPNYVNPDPKICSFFFQDSVAASTELGGLWRHNYRCDLYSNYYGVDYPWEIEITENTGQLVNTVRSLEYQLECYVYKGDLYNGCGDDRWHDLDYNFDQLIVHNTEQVSGLLLINEQPKNDPIERLNFPQVNLNNIDIVASKIEQKYRINQFWDITNDRGEFTNVEQQIFDTEENGYIRNLNQINLDYEKSALQRKKFRHYHNKFILTRRISADRKMLLKLNNTKLNLSFR